MRSRTASGDIRRISKSHLIQQGNKLWRIFLTNEIFPWKMLSSANLSISTWWISNNASTDGNLLEPESLVFKCCTHWHFQFCPLPEVHEKSFQLESLLFVVRIFFARKCLKHLTRVSRVMIGGWVSGKAWTWEEHEKTLLGTASLSVMLPADGKIYLIQWWHRSFAFLLNSVCFWPLCR